MYCMYTIGTRNGVLAVVKILLTLNYWLKLLLITRWVNDTQCYAISHFQICENMKFIEMNVINLYDDTHELVELNNMSPFGRVNELIITCFMGTETALNWMMILLWFELFLLKRDILSHRYICMKN